MNRTILISALSFFVFAAGLCSSQGGPTDPGGEIRRNEACMESCQAKKCAAHADCRSNCEQKGMAPAVQGCLDQCEIKFRYCEDACASECEARHPVR